MAAAREQALSLLAAVNNHGDLAVKLSSLKQVKDILSSVEPSLAAELFPYLAELQSSRESLVRKSLVETIKEVGLRVMEHSYVLLAVLLVSLRDEDPVVVKQAIATGTNFYCSILEEVALQFLHRGKVERWAGELWTWMVKFKDAVSAIALEPDSVGTKVLALKFLETFVLLFTPDTSDSEKIVNEGNRRMFNISWLAGGHPILNAAMLMSEANRTFGILLDLLQSASSLPGAVTITVITCLATVARRRAIHYYSTVVSALLDSNLDFETVKGRHAASVQYSIRTALLGFLRCTYPPIIESRDKLVRALRAMNAGDAADQVIRQVDKMIRNSERTLRENWSGRDNQVASHQHISGDLSKKRLMPQDSEDMVNGEITAKRVRYGLNTHLAPPVPTSDSLQDPVSVNGVSSNGALLDGDLTPVEQMIAMIGALLAEGERGAGSLEILISKLHPDMLADIVITNMKHLPKDPLYLTRFGSTPSIQSISLVGNQAQIVAPSPPTNSMQSPALPGQLPFSSSSAISSSFSDISGANNLAADSRRDPRRDPRRLDPRRANTSTGSASVPVGEGTDAKPSEVDVSILLNKPLPAPVVTADESAPAHPVTNIRSDIKTTESSSVTGINQLNGREEVLAASEESVPITEVKASLDVSLSPTGTADADFCEMNFSTVETKYDPGSSSFLDFDEHSPAPSNTIASDETCKELPSVPSYVQLTKEKLKSVGKSAVGQIIESYKHIHGVKSSQMRMALLARLVAEIDADYDILAMLRKHILVDYREHKGHELVLHVLYHLHSLVTMGLDEYSSSAAVAYENFLLAVAKSLLDTLPASDKSFSRLLGEVPQLPDSAIKLLDNLCNSSVHDPNGKEIRDGERVTQGLGAVWSLIIGRPNNRQTCLDIALKCSIHSEDDIRGKAIRLVTNKLYLLSYISGHIEQFATDRLLSAVNSEMDNSQSWPADQSTEREVRSQETSISGSQVSESGMSETDSERGAQPAVSNVSTMSFPEVQRLISLFFALCKKKPRLLQLVFDVYGRSPKVVKQAFHRHIPILIRALGSSSSELLQIISDPPQGSENLLTLVLQILTQETVPSPDLISTVKHLYETKLKDVTILIPLLSSLSKNEVLPIFPRLVNLPLDKFQMALAHVLQGSAHTGPALTPAEVLIAIHAIVPEKDGLPLKKITDACSACFEQRTVFTQQVLAKALNQMVDQTSLPLLFMRTVIQAIDAYPTLVDFVMEILSKLVSKQIWRLPKLWVGFLKCVSQTQPHSFPVLLKLPPPQLESTLNKFASLRGPLTAFASQPTIKASLPSSILATLGLAIEPDTRHSHIPSLHPSDASSSVHGAT